jgi:3-dehydroquinate synthase
VLHRLEPLLHKQVSQERLFVFYDARFYALHGRRVQSQLRRFRRRTVEMVIPSGEKSKSAAVLNKLYAFLLNEKISRTDFILACGGGMTSDLAGYAAATTLRGIRWGIVSTTLLGMVDAAIGGKTGINHAVGKNLIGAFWQPSFVVCDTNFLATLPRREFIAGLGEMVKYGGLIGPRMLRLLERYLSGPDLLDSRLLPQLVFHAVSYKARIVADDEREAGRRMFLNLGHTFAHAIEHAVGYGQLLHGEAVMLGLHMATELSCLLQPSRRRRLEDYQRIIERLMRLIPYRNLTPPKIKEAMQLDKKRAGLRQRFVLLDRPGRPVITERVSTKPVTASIKKTLDVYQAIGGTNAAYSGC